MALEVGSRLGHYDVTALIGEGGMGQVYQVTNTKLNRQVALKILPEVFATDPDRLARFQREAQVLASLNHPNIAQIHGLEESDDTRALVLELVEGPTLADRIKQGPIPVDEALPIAKQIAEALEAAHEAGVIHRDLKPANIKVRNDGTVKVLDFGLAKALDTTPDGDPSQSPTLTAAATQMGVIMGTAAYMSPEQARGKPVDRRADIWAFGCVLYEMLTGRRAFAGDDLTDTIAAVVRSEPAWDALPDDVSSRITQILRACLQKDGSRRVRDIGDVQLAIDGTFETTARDPSAASPTFRFWQRPGTVAAAVLFALTVGVVVGTLRSPRSAPAAETGVVTRSVITLPVDERLALAALAPAGVGRPSLALSPDGTRLAYVVDRDGTSEISLRQLDQFESRALPGTEGAFHPFFSPDGQWIGFFTPTELKKVSVRGGTPITLCFVRYPLGASWGLDGTIVFSELEGKRLSRVSADGGEPTVVPGGEIVDDTEYLRFPELLPDGRGVLVTAVVGSTPRIVFISSETGEQRTLLERARSAHYVSTGHLVYAGEGGAVARRFDPVTLDVSGSPVPILEDVRLEGHGGAIQWAFSANGLLAYVPGVDAAISVPVWVTRESFSQPWTRGSARVSSEVRRRPSSSTPSASYASSRIISWHRFAVLSKRSSEPISSFMSLTGVTHDGVST